MAGVGKATVSRVINNSGYVSAATRSRVEKAVADAVFVPSSAARALSRQKSETIGVVIPEADNAFFWDALNGISEVADARGLDLMICNSNNMMEKDIRSFQTMCRQRVRGVIFTPAVAYNTPQKLAAIREQIEKLDAPVVLLDRPVDGLDLDGVYSDNYAGAYAAVKVLIEAGHSKIGIVTGDPDLRIGRERFEGFRDAMRDYGLPVEKSHVAKGMFNIRVAYRNARELLSSRDRPTAFFAANNLCGIGFLHALFERGMKTPDDVGFICFDHLGYLTEMQFNLSYLDRDVAGMGTEAIRLLEAKMERRGGARGDVVFPPRLVLLGSEKRPGRRAE